ncbi:MAG: hypothetical protein K0R68_849 [Mycobacterium sp.]|nr:hypothetical protein [Mycobacterium sp.]
MKLLAAVLVVALTAGSGVAAAAPVTPPVPLPPAGGAPDYQLGAAYPPPEHVTIVARDRTVAAGGEYAICYVNAFQTQPGELSAWPAEVVLRGADGAAVSDPDWPDEVLIDTRTPAQREAVVGVVSRWITGCAENGYHAVEFDNLDSYTRTGGVLRREDAVTLARRFAAIAHDAGLAAAQKNAAEDTTEFRAAGFDFAVAEECAAFHECSSYTDVYGAHVVAVEYTDNLPRSFAQVCADPATPASVVLRDRDLVASSAPGYHFELCPAASPSMAR